MMESFHKHGKNDFKFFKSVYISITYNIYWRNTFISCHNLYNNGMNEKYS